MIAGARNGPAFTGKIVAGSSKRYPQPQGHSRRTPRGLGATIPAANVRIRYGVPWGEYRQVNAGNRKLPTPYPAYAQRLGALAEKPLAEFPVLADATDDYSARPSGRTHGGQAGAGAVVPSMDFRRGSAAVPAGKYSGSVKVEAEAGQPVQVPIELRVADWSLPDIQDFRTWVDMIQCPDTLALEYKVPLWSDRHWEIDRESFRLMGETGSRTMYVPLIARTNLGNEQSMVRWVRKGDKYDYDFSVLDRYFDAAEKNMGTARSW